MENPNPGSFGCCQKDSAKEEVKVEVPKPKVSPKEEKVEVQPSPIASNSNSAAPIAEADAKPISPFEIKVKQLEEMGFLERATNIELLVKYRGDIVQVIKKLLEL